MSNDFSYSGVSNAVISPLTAEADKLLHPHAAPAESQKIESSAKDFEALLLSSWLQQAEQSFGSVPGADEDEDADPGKDQLQGIAMQALGHAMTASGGIGLAKMVAAQLHKTAGSSATDPAKTQPPGH